MFANIDVVLEHGHIAILLTQDAFHLFITSGVCVVVLKGRKRSAEGDKRGCWSDIPLCKDCFR